MIELMKGYLKKNICQSGFLNENRFDIKIC
jgi:hypothetical protein